MKKILVLLAAILGVTAMVSAQEIRYKVTISVQVNYTYQDENGNTVGNDYAAGTPQVIYVMASTPYEAERKALDECSSMCRTAAWKNEGYKKYNGKLYQCYSTKEPYSATATPSARY